MRAPMRERLQAVLDVRAQRPGAIAEAAARRKRRQALQMPSVRGLVAGRALLFPPDDNVAGAVDAAVGLMRG